MKARIKPTSNSETLSLNAGIRPKPSLPFKIHSVSWASGCEQNIKLPPRCKGMLFLGLEVVPITRALQPPGSGAHLIRAVGRSFRPIAWVCIGALVITGTVNLDHWGHTLACVFSRDLLETEFGKILAIKLSVVPISIILSILHDFVLGPRRVRIMEAVAHTTSPQTEGPTTAVVIQRRRLSMLVRLNALLALSFLALSVVLVRGLP